MSKRQKYYVYTYAIKIFALKKVIFVFLPTFSISLEYLNFPGHLLNLQEPFFKCSSLQELPRSLAEGLMFTREPYRHTFTAIGEETWSQIGINFLSLFY